MPARTIPGRHRPPADTVLYAVGDVHGRAHVYRALIEGLILQNRDLDNALRLKPQLDGLLQTFRYEPTRVAPACWWAGRDKPQALVAALVCCT